ncbi:MAG: hypothetical protein J5674_02945 [Candidatus Methanomethylophilaceae archaeon]|nr:hypothetical protein [Candidatus Methanomethylophilaceae archaeon]
MKQIEYKIELVRGYILVNDDRGSKVLIDTGSPLSFHADGIVALGGRTFNVRTSLMGVDDGYVTDNVGTRIDGLVGMDVLGECGILVDVPGGRIVLSHPTDGMTRVPSSVEFGYVFLDMDMHGRGTTVIFDTGAPTSYVSASFTKGLVPVDHVVDFNPSVPGGKFETLIFEFPATFAGKAFTMRAGHLPHLAQALTYFGVGGVVGMELLKQRPFLIADGGVWIGEETVTSCGHED